MLVNDEELAYAVLLQTERSIYQMLLYHTSCYIVSVSDRNLLWAGIVSGLDKNSKTFVR